MVVENYQVTVPEVRQLLDYFRELQELAQMPLPEKNNGLWEKAKQEARDELIEKLKQRERGMTLHPNPTRQTRQPTDAGRRAIEAAIEVAAGGRYLALDAGYSSVLKEREQHAYDLVKTIDHFITPIRHKLRVLPEAQRTLLVAEWQEIREKLSINEIMTLDGEGKELYARTIRALEAVERKLLSENGLARKIWKGCLELVGVVAYFFSKGRG